MANKRTAPTETGPSLQIKLKKGEDESAAMARHSLRPNLIAVGTIASFQSLPKVGDLTAMLDDMDSQAMKVQAGDLGRPEEMLSAQAHTLDIIFNTLARKAAANMNAGYAGATETYLRLALKAQSQCRTTVEALAEIKYPKSATFIKQANIAQQQQVNNGHSETNTPERAHEKNITPTNKLLSESTNATLDTRGTREAIGIDQGASALAALNRAAH